MRSQRRTSIPSSQTPLPDAHQWWVPLLGLGLYIGCLVLLLALGHTILRSYRWRNRGVEYPPQILPQVKSDNSWGVNAALERYQGSALDQALEMIQAAGFTHVRQRFPWDAMEPRPGAYAWASWDRLVETVAEYDLHLIAVLERSPAWARAPEDQDNAFAPPVDMDAFAAWAAAFAERYPDMTAYQIWDQPNIAPHWGDRDVDPAGYVKLLAAGYRAIKTLSPRHRVLSASLAPNTEPGDDNLSDVNYLQGMYANGAAAYFDILGAKAYGFWSGPWDRRVNPEVLNYSRLILLRETMREYGDAETPIWAVEMGWNALPPTWPGRVSPWGTDTAARQADRTLQALQRAQSEWSWLELVCVRTYQPAAALDDPAWGFALVTPEGEPRLLYEELTRFFLSPESQRALYRPPRRRLLTALAFLGLGVLVLLWRSHAQLQRLPWQTWWRGARSAYVGLASWQQGLLFGGSLAVYLIAPGLGLALMALWVLLVLTYWEPRWMLWYTVVMIPFTSLRRYFGHLAFTPIEVLTLLCVSGVGLRFLSRALDDSWAGLTPRRLFARLWLNWRGLDRAWFLFVVIGVLSLANSAQLAASLRELRTMIVEPALLYLLIAHHLPLKGDRDPAKALRLGDALVVSGIILAGIGLTQYLLGRELIVAEGVRRIRAIYGSPNNLALVLGRFIPLAAAFTLWGEPSRRRRLYSVGLALMLPCLFLTFSRGAWLVGLPAAMLFLGVIKGRQVALAMLAAVVIGVLLLIPLAGTDRIASLLNPQEGTSFIRLSLWQSAVAMIRDHPLQGVGLDQFLYHYPTYMLEAAAQEPNLSHPHNILLDYWTRLGIAGVLTIIWFIASYFQRSRKLYHRLPRAQRILVLGLMAGMVYMIAHGLVDNAYFVTELAFIFAVHTGCVSQLGRRKEEN